LSNVDSNLPLISVGMSVFNAGQTIAAAIRSLQLQTYTKWELIIVDDGSTDQSMDIVQSFYDSRIQIRRDGLNKGLAVRLNEAIDLSRGSFFARMDADDLSFPARFETQVAFLEQHPAVDLVGASALIFKDEGNPTGLISVAASHEEICRRPWATFYLPHPTWMGRIDWFRKQRYDPGMLKAQDIELLLRTFDSSRFGGLTRPLLGYRRDTSAIGKRLRSRLYASTAVLRAARRRSELGFAIKGLGLLGAKALVDLFSGLTGKEDLLRVNRHDEIDPGLRLEWQSLWARCSSGPGKPCAE
jgi:glycosyltransferase involved in cell wall biosynthesis